MKIIFFGDSVTEGCFELFETEKGMDTYRRPELCFASKVADRLKKKYGDGIEVINAGVSGNNTKNALDRIDRDVIGKKPDLCVVCFGLNDVWFYSSLEYGKNIREIYDRLLAAGIKVICLTPNMMCTHISANLTVGALTAEKISEKQNKGILDRLVADSKLAAGERGIDICDVYAYWKRLADDGADTTELLSNYINHPTAEMHDKVADMLMPVIEKYVIKATN